MVIYPNLFVSCSCSRALVRRGYDSESPLLPGPGNPARGILYYPSPSKESFTIQVRVRNPLLSGPGPGLEPELPE